MTQPRTLNVDTKTDVSKLNGLTTLITSDDHTSHLTGLKALTDVGMPWEFAAVLLQIAEEFGVIFAVRAGLPLQLYRELAAAKPSCVKDKNSTDSLLGAVIPEDILQFGKRDKNGHLIYKEHHITPSNDMRMEWIQHKIPLSRIIKNIENNCYELVDDKNQLLTADAYQKKNTHTIRLRNIKNPSQAIICIDLSKTHATPPDVNRETLKRILTSEEREAQKPKWWNDAWGDFAVQRDYFYPASYIDHVNAPEIIKPLKVLAMEDRYYKQKRLLPITGDMDLLYITHPTEHHRQELLAHYIQYVSKLSLMELYKLKKNSLSEKIRKYRCKLFASDRAKCSELIELLINQRREQLYISAENVHDVVNTYSLQSPDNTNEIKACEAALEQIADIAERLGLPATKIPKEIFRRNGCITIFEAFIINLVNQKFNQVVPNLHNLIQHGPEVNNPGMPSDINDKMIHIGHPTELSESPSASIEETENESQLIAKIHEPQYAKNNVVKIPKGWVDRSPMWQPIAKEQLDSEHTQTPSMARPTSRRQSQDMTLVTEHRTSRRFTFSLFHHAPVAVDKSRTNSAERAVHVDKPAF